MATLLGAIPEGLGVMIKVVTGHPTCSTWFGKYEQMNEANQATGTRRMMMTKNSGILKF